MRYLLIIGGALVLWAWIAGPGKASEVEADSMYAQMLEPSYKLYKSGTANCSATVIHSAENENGMIETYLLTAAHCVGDDMSIRKQSLDEKLDPIKETIYYAKNYKVIKSTDVAVLKLIDDQDKFPVALIAPLDTKLRKGREVWAVGYPKVLDLTITHGEWTGLAKNPKDKKTLLNRATTPIHGGNSGGGLYARINNKYMIVGVASGRWTDASFMNYFTLLSSIYGAIPSDIGKAKSANPVHDF